MATPAPVSDHSEKYLKGLGTLTLANGKTWTYPEPKPKWENLAAGQGCVECDNPRGGPLHFGGSNCKSHGMGAADGTRAHCSCDGCY